VIAEQDLRWLAAERRDEQLREAERAQSEAAALAARRNGERVARWTRAVRSRVWVLAAGLASSAVIASALWVERPRQAWSHVACMGSAVAAPTAATASNRSVTPPEPAPAPIPPSAESQPIHGLRLTLDLARPPAERR